MEATQKRFQSDPYLKDCQCIIAKIDKDTSTIILSSTIFAPTAGGQECDLGTIDDISVLGVVEDNGILYHKMASLSAKWKEGKTVHCQLDWSRRFDHMQNHCGEHILSGLFFREYQAQNKGFHLGRDYSTLDVDMKNLSLEVLDKIENLANDVISDQLEIRTTFIEDKKSAAKLSLRKELKVEEDILIVTIDGVDCVACCCPHPKNTGEIGLIKILKAENYKGMTRIYFICGLRALRDYQKKHTLILHLNDKYSATEDILLPQIKLQENKNNQLRQELHFFKDLFFEGQASELLAHQLDSPAPLICKGYDNQTLDDLKLIAKKMLGQTDALILLYTKSALTVLLSHSGKNSFHCGQMVKEFACGFGGKGGGTQTFAQALFTKFDIMENFIDIVRASLK